MPTRETNANNGEVSNGERRLTVMFSIVVCSFSLVSFCGCMQHAERLERNVPFILPID